MNNVLDTDIDICNAQVHPSLSFNDEFFMHLIKQVIPSIKSQYIESFHLRLIYKVNYIFIKNKIQEKWRKHGSSQSSFFNPFVSKTIIWNKGSSIETENIRK